MKKLIGNILILIATLFVLSCQEELEPGGTATQAAAGEWWVKSYLDDGTGNLVAISDYYKVMTFNTSTNTADSLWLSDVGNFWNFQVKTQFDASAKTFAVSEATNISYADSEVTIENGAVFLNQGKSSSGVKTDSIYFVSSFNDETDTDSNLTPYATKIYIAGHRRTGFLEDEHE